MKTRPLAPQGGNDKIWTPDYLAVQIVGHFRPDGRILEPCRGDGAFLRAMPTCDWCEIDEGRDFLTCNGCWDWIITNPPWSQFRPFLNRAMSVADNVVFLSLVNAFFMRARVEDMRRHGFGIAEILMLPTPSKPWPQTGFQLGATRIMRGYSGPATISFAKSSVNKFDSLPITNNYSSSIQSRTDP